MVVADFLSEDESIVAQMGNYHLTEDRVIYCHENGKNKDYKDIQLDKLDSFTHVKRFNHSLVLIGAFTGFVGLVLGFSSPNIDPTASLVIVLAGLLIVFYAYWSVKENYEIKSSGGTKISLSASNTPDFWKEINKQKN